MFSCPVVHSNCFCFSWTASKGCEVSDTDIHPLKSICGRLADKESTFRSTGFCRIFATELEDGRPKTVPYLEEVVE